MAADITYSPPIELYNPHDTPLHIKEIFTSGGFLHLNLPPDATGDLWVSADEQPAVFNIYSSFSNKNNLCLLYQQFKTLAPHTRKRIMDLAFVSGQPGKYTGFVSIKTDFDNMILHVDVLVVKGRS